MPLQGMNAFNTVKRKFPQKLIPKCIFASIGLKCKGGFCSRRYRIDEQHVKESALWLFQGLKYLGWYTMYLPPPSVAVLKRIKC